MKIHVDSKKLLSLVLSEGATDGLSEDKIFELWTDKKSTIISGLSSFRAHQSGKKAWTNPWKTMLGIKKWNRSTASKRFHRQLGRFLATRIMYPKHRTEKHGFQMTFGGDDKEKKHSMLTGESFTDVYPILTSIASIRTHLYIERDYINASIAESVEIASLVDFSIPLLQEVESALFESQNLLIELTPLAEELLYRLTERSVLIRCFGEQVGISEKDSNDLYRSCFDIIKKEYDINEDFFVTRVFSLMRDSICQ